MLSVEHGVIWPLDSLTTSMKAVVNSGDACHANELQLEYCRYLRATPHPKKKNSLNVLPVSRVYQLSSFLCPLPHF